MLNSPDLEIEGSTSEDLKSPIRPNISREFEDIAYGCVDSIDHHGVSGWYVHKSNENPLLQVSVSGMTVGYCRPKVSRPDISAILGRQTECGFSFKWSELTDSPALQMLAASSDPIVGLEVTCLQSGRVLHQLVPQQDSQSNLRSWVLPHVQRHARVTQARGNCGPVSSRSVAAIAMPPASCRLDMEVAGGNKVSGRVIWNATDEETLQPIEVSFYLGQERLHSLSLSPKRPDSQDIVSRSFSWSLPAVLLDGEERMLEVRAASSGRATVSKSVTFGHGYFDSDLKYLGAGLLEGFIVERASLASASPVHLYVDSTRIFDITPDISPLRGRKQGAFSLSLPAEFLDGAPHVVELRVGAKTLSTIHVVHALRGHIDALNGHEVTGWIYDPAGDAPLELVVKVDDVELPAIVADASRNDVGRACGFHCDLSRATQGKAAFSVSIELKHAKIPVLQTPRSYFRTDGLIEIVRKIASGGQQMALNGLDQMAVAKYLGPRLIRMLRNEVGQGIILGSTPPVVSETVKVIVPVYDGLEETLRCLLELFKSKAENATEFDVVLIDDCGPNPAIGPVLKKIAQRPDVSLIVNDQNMGFVRSVNKALRLTAGYDVVLLNADAVVNGDWLDRIRRTAYTDPHVASVTPFSNNATICSYPDPELENSMPTDLTLKEIDQLCAAANSGMAVEIPSGVGFCMYMKATAISEVGLLDAEKFGMGYGEENDWCVRARDLGWKHMHACDTFVEHIGGVSFGKDKKNNLVEKNLVVLGQAYPEYTPIIMDFIKSDPARVYRNRITVERMRQLLSPFNGRHLYISHSFGGGIDVFCKNQAKDLEQQNIATIMLESVGGSEMRLYYGDLNATYRTKTDIAELRTALRSLLLGRIHINSDIGLSSAIWDLPKELEVPMDVTIHDYTSVCPRVNFMTRDGTYCGEPTDVRNCDRCISKDGTYAYLDANFKSLGNSVSGWRAFYLSKLSEADNVYAPDSDAVERMQKYFPALKVKVRPHEFSGVIPEILPPAVGDGEVMRIAVIGAIGPHKGFDLLHACIANAHQHDLPLQFVIVGYTCNDQQLKKYQNVLITGKFEQEMLEDILAEHDCHAALFLSPWPETYSFTLTEALLSGLWPVVLPIGAQASRLKAMNCGTVLPYNATAKDVNQALLSLGFH